MIITHSFYYNLFFHEKTYVLICINQASNDHVYAIIAIEIKQLSRYQCAELKIFLTNNLDGIIRPSYFMILKKIGITSLTTHAIV